MNVDWQALVGNLFVGLAIAVVSARATVSFALRRFYSEKGWERKDKAYTKIIEAIHHIRDHADHNYTFSMLDKDMPKDGEKELEKEMTTAIAELRKQLDIGTFVISDEAVTVLGDLMSDLDESTKTSSWIEHLALKLTATERCLAAMRNIARRDLGLPLRNPSRTRRCSQA